MNFSGNPLTILKRITYLCINIFCAPVLSQSIIAVPSDVEFAGVTIHLTEENRSKVRKEVQRLYAHPEHIDYLRRTTKQLAPHLALLFKKANVPNDFLYMALPCSDTDTLGFWRLSQDQGKRLNLQINDQVDERFHAFISTVAVLSDINYWQKAQKNYAASLLCYLNGSMPPISERITERYLSPSTQSTPLFWEVLARKLVLNHLETTSRAQLPYVLYEYQNSEGKTLQDVVDQLQIPLDRTNTFNRWLKEGQIPITKHYSLLIQVTPKEYTQIQSSRRSTEEAKFGAYTDNGFPILRKVDKQHKGMRASALFYRINDRKGIQAQHCDSPITLAFYGNISIKAFLKYNDLSNDDVVYPGEIYYLESKAKRAKIPFHIVQKGQTLHSISHLYGVKLKSLQKFNYVVSTQRLQTKRILWLQHKRPTNKVFETVQALNKDTDENEVETSTETQEIIDVIDDNPDIIVHSPELNLADSLLVKNKTEMDVSKSSEPFLSKRLNTKSQKSTTKGISPSNIDRIKDSSYHIVQPMQTLYRISIIYKVTVFDLMRWNNLSSYTIKVGQKLIIQRL